MLKYMPIVLVFSFMCITNTYGQTDKTDNLVEAYLDSAFMDKANGKFQSAIEDYNKVIELRPENASNYESRGDLKFKLEDYRGAIKDYTKALGISKGFILYRKRSSAKFKLGDYRGVIKDLTMVIKLIEESELLRNRMGKYLQAAYLNRGIAKLNIEKKDSGCLDFSRAGELGLSKAYEMIKRKCN